MTKRALIVIAIIIIIPVAVTLYYFMGWRSRNPVVADWKENTSTVSYHGTELHEVPGSSVYRFSVGKYLGKIADRLTGASLYRVEGDESGGLYAVVDSARTRLFTSGVPVPEGAFSGEKVTGVFTSSGRYGDSKELNEAVELILTERQDRVLLEESEWSKIQKYDLYVCFDGSRISAVSSGVVAGPTERGRWYFLPPEEDAEADAEEESSEAVETAKDDADSVEVYEIVSVEAVSALKAFLTGTGDSAAASSEEPTG